MKVLITGAGGFLGSWLAEDFKNAGHEVFGLTRADADLMDRQQLRQVIKSVNPHCVVHSAGLVGGIEANMKNNYRFLLDNVIMGANVVATAFECDVPKLINMSSSCVYPPNSPQPFNELQILTGSLEKTNEGYALAKIATQKITEYISSEYGLSYRTLIPSNLYGPRDNFHPDSSHMLASILLKIQKAKRNKLDTVEIWGDGTARREFTYVGDLSEWVAKEAINLLSEFPSSLNVGFGSDHSVSDYYMTVADVMEYQGGFKFLLEKPIGMHQKLMDSSTASRFGWKAKTELTEGIKITAKWMENNVKLG